MFFCGKSWIYLFVPVRGTNKALSYLRMMYNLAVTNKHVKVIHVKVMSSLSGTLPNYLICPSIHFIRFRQSRTCPSCPGRTPLFTPRCSRRSASLSLSMSLPALLRVNSPFRSWSCGSSIWTRPQGEAIMSTASRRRGHGNPLDVPADATPSR